MGVRFGKKQFVVYMLDGMLKGMVRISTVESHEISGGVKF